MMFACLGDAPAAELQLAAPLQPFLLG